jgi:hypothetical protein
MANSTFAVYESTRPIIDPGHRSKTPRQRVSTIVSAATSTLIAWIGAVYQKNHDISPLNNEPTPKSPLEPQLRSCPTLHRPQTVERL